MKYYYKTKNGNGYLCLKSPLNDTNEYIEITEVQFNEHIENEKPTEAQLAKENELASLLSWFKHYDEQCMQYARHQRLGIESDIDIEALDAEATTNAARIKELRD